VAGPIAKAVIDTYLLDILELDFAKLDRQAEAGLVAADRMVTRSND
jgi:hypothetical protein